MVQPIGFSFTTASRFTRFPLVAFAIASPMALSQKTCDSSLGLKFLRKSFIYIHTQHFSKRLKRAEKLSLTYICLDEFVVSFYISQVRETKEVLDHGRSDG